MREFRAIFDGIKKISRQVCFAKSISSLKNDLMSFYNCKVILADITGRGATFTFLVYDLDGRKLCIAKLKNWRRESISKRKNSRFKEFIYLEPKTRFLRESNILDKLYKKELAPRPLKATNNYLLVEYLEGESVSNIIKIFPDRFPELYLKGIKILKKLHEQDIYHGEPSFDNMILNNNQVKIIDFEHCLDKKTLSREQMATIDFFRLMLNTERSFPFLHSNVYKKVSEFLKSEIDSDIIERIKEIIKLPLIRDNRGTIRILNLIISKIDRSFLCSGPE